MSEEIERTEELLDPVKNHGRKKKKIMIPIAIILIIISGIGIYLITSNIKDSNYKKELSLGNKYLEEGLYNEAILAFDKAIEIEGKLPEAYEMKAKACTASGDYETAKEIYVKLYDTSGDSRFKELEDNVGMGNTSGNLANGGIATKSEDALYVGNKPRAGSITRIKNGEETVIYETENNIKYICDLNIGGEWLYFTIRNMGGLGLAEEKPQNGIYKVKIDGSGFTALKFSEISEYYYYDLSLQGSKLYVLHSNKSGRSLYQMDLNGNNAVKVVNEEERLKCYTVDGENLYYFSSQELVCVDKNGKRVLEKSDYADFIYHKMFVNDGRIYYLTKKTSEDSMLYSIKTDGSDKKNIFESTLDDDVSSISTFNVTGDRLYYAKIAKSDGSPSTEYSHVLEIHVRDLNNDTDQILIKEDAKASDLGYSSLDRIYAYVGMLTLVDNKIYYEVRAGSGVGGSYEIFFRMNQDGTENEVISLK